MTTAIHATATPNTPEFAALAAFLSASMDIRMDGGRMREALRAISNLHAAEAHPDDIAVERFAAAMKAKLAEARAKGRSGWDTDPTVDARLLSNMLREHVEKGDPRDVANFCMFLWCRDEIILAEPKGQEFFAVLAPSGDQGVIFKDERDASWTATGRGRTSCRYGGVPTVGDNFRDIYDEQEKFALIKVQAATAKPGA